MFRAYSLQKFPPLFGVGALDAIVGTLCVYFFKVKALSLTVAFFELPHCLRKTLPLRLSLFCENSCSSAG